MSVEVSRSEKAPNNGQVGGFNPAASSKREVGGLNEPAACASNRRLGAALVCLTAK